MTQSAENGFRCADIPTLPSNAAEFCQFMRKLAAIWPANAARPREVGRQTEQRCLFA
jgi:hypothetical protein